MMLLILALAQTKESNWRWILYQNIYEKNQKPVEAHDNPDFLIWNLWNRKEAVYKIYNQRKRE
jgi:hypothetical protein